MPSVASATTRSGRGRLDGLGAEQRRELAALGDAVDRDHAPGLADGAEDRHQPDRPAADHDDRAAPARRRHGRPSRSPSAGCRPGRPPPRPRRCRAAPAGSDRRSGRARARPGRRRAAGRRPSSRTASAPRTASRDPPRTEGQVPSEIMLVLTTRWPTRTSRTSEPTSTTTPGELVPEHRAVLEARRHAVEREEVGAADRGRPHLDDGVGRLLDHGISDRLHADVTDTGEHHGPHAGCSISTRKPSGSTQKKRQPPQGGS